MKFIPQGTQIRGRRLEIVRTEGGIHLPASTNRGITKFVYVDAVGPEVKQYKPGQVVLPHHLNFVALRDGHTHVLFEEKEVMELVEDLPQEHIVFEDVDVDGERPSIASSAGAPS